jgi:hypothetical protein
MADRRVLGVAARMHQTQHYFARVDANADLDPRPAGRRYCWCVRLQ